LAGLCGPAVGVVFDVVGDEEAFEDAADGLLVVVGEAAWETWMSVRSVRACWVRLRCLRWVVSRCG
jgi:hypothetical protein